jgi:hypothetical protein
VLVHDLLQHERAKGDLNSMLSVRPERQSLSADRSAARISDSLSEEVNKLAKNTDKGYREGAVRDRSQFQTPSGDWAKRNDKTGRIMDVKQDGKPFKGVRREK